MGAAFALLLIAAVVVSWVLAGIKSHQHGDSKGVLLFFYNLLAAVGAVFVLWLLIVYPILDCHTFLCGLENMAIWLLISLILMIVWPLVFISIIIKKWPKEKTINKVLSEDILDEEL